jgi:hypothetical protein
MKTIKLIHRICLALIITPAVEQLMNDIRDVKKAKQ